MVPEKPLKVPLRVSATEEVCVRSPLNGTMVACNICVAVAEFCAGDARGRSRRTTPSFKMALHDLPRLIFLEECTVWPSARSGTPNVSLFHWGVVYGEGSAIAAPMFPTSS